MFFSLKSISIQEKWNFDPWIMAAHKSMKKSVRNTFHRLLSVVTISILLWDTCMTFMVFSHCSQKCFLFDIFHISSVRGKFKLILWWTEYLALFGRESYRVRARANNVCKRNFQMPGSCAFSLASVLKHLLFWRGNFISSLYYTDIEGKPRTCLSCLKFDFSKLFILIENWS